MDTIDVQHGTLRHVGRISRNARRWPEDLPYEFAHAAFLLSVGVGRGSARRWFHAGDERGRGQRRQVHSGRATARLRAEVKLARRLVDGEVGDRRSI